MLEIEIVSSSLTPTEAACLCVVLARIFSKSIKELDNAATCN